MTSRIFENQRTKKNDPLVRENMIQYLTWDACDFSWEAVKGAHSAFPHRMGDGIIDWNIAEFQKNQTQTNSIQVQDRQTTTKTAFCIQFNKGQCNRPADHEWKHFFT